MVRWGTGQVNKSKYFTHIYIFWERSMEKRGKGNVHIIIIFLYILLNNYLFIFYLLLGSHIISFVLQMYLYNIP